MDVDHDVTPITPKKKLEKTSPDSSSIKLDTKKSERKSDFDDPKPRIVLTFRSEKPGAKSSNMKIVPTEEKHEEISPRRSSRACRTRSVKWDSGDDNDVLQKSQPHSENDDVSDSSRTPKRSTRRIIESDNVIADARKEKSFNEAPAPTRLSRRIKPTAKVLANEELRIGLESQNNARLGIQQEKSPEEGVRTRGSIRSSRQNAGAQEDSVQATKSNRDVDGESQNQVMKLKHLCELGLKAISPGGPADDAKDDREAEESEAIEIEDDPEEDEEIDDDTEVISKLLEADDDSLLTSDGDEEFVCSELPQGERPRRSSRLCTMWQWAKKDEDSDRSSPAPEEDEQSAPRRRSSRRRRIVAVRSYEDIVGSYLPQHKKSRSTVQPSEQVEDSNSEGEQEEISNPAGGDEGSEAACPGDESTVLAECFCEAESNVYAAPSELTDPVFCQAIEVVEGVRVGCSHAARREAPLARAGPRAPYLLPCALHQAQLRAHMCCPACGLFCTQGIFYQCSKKHLFHLECGLPYNDSKAKPGCPHCGVHSYRWQPANRDCCKVKVEMKCSNKRIFLPDQREQCTPAYLSFSTLDPSQLDTGPVIPEDLLPSPPIDLKRLCGKRDAADCEDALGGSQAERLCEAILAGETADQLIPKIMSVPDLNACPPRAGGGTCAHVAAARAHLAALYLLQYAGADLDAPDDGARTPLMLAVLALLDKSDKKSPKKTKLKSEKDTTPETEITDDHSKRKEKENAAEKLRESEIEKPNDEDLMKVIRYLVACGCDVDAVGPDGMTALHMAAQLGGAAACGALLAGGARPEPRDHGGWTPLVWAAENGHAHVVRLLLSYGADAEATDDEGNAAAHWCALAGAARALQLLLAAAPAAHAATNHHADTPLHVAARQGHYDCVVILLARGARTDVENSAGELPVEVCSGQCQSAISLNMQMSLAASDPRARRPRCVLSSDISRGRELHPIPCVNEVDDEPLPEDFTYVTRHVMPRAIPIDTTTQTMQGCECKDGDCSSASCACTVLGVRQWYARARGRAPGRLRPGFPYHDPPMLFECNHTCGCNAKRCTNSVISRLCASGSVFARAQVFRAGGARGWALRAGGAVPRGAPVAAYCGELLAVGDADARSADQYMFALDVKPDLLEQCSEKVQLCVDAARYGGAARFINHSCRPNLAPVRVFTATRDLRLPTVALFALADIAAGEEFTFDYGDKFWSVKSKWMKCECGAPDCRYPEQTAEEAES